VSFAHVATVGASWQTAPVAAQIVELQVHAAIPPVIAHVWWLPHMAVVAHCVQPPGWVWQVCTPPEAHSVRPAVQPSVHPELPLVELAVLMDVLVPPGPALLDVELLVIALLVDVLVPVAPKPAAELLVLELPFEPRRWSSSPLPRPRLRRPQGSHSQSRESNRSPRGSGSRAPYAGESPTKGPTVASPRPLQVQDGPIPTHARRDVHRPTRGARPHRDSGRRESASHADRDAHAHEDGAFPNACG